MARWILSLLVGLAGLCCALVVAGCAGATAARAALAAADGGQSSPGDHVDSGESAEAGGRVAPEGGATKFAPYFPAWTFGAKGYAYTSLVNLQQTSGVNDVTLAFVLADSDGGCASDLAADGIGANLADIQAFVAAGGHAKLSFGGADGLYLQDPSACTSATELADAIGSVVDATGIADLDFDIEQPFTPGMSEEANQNLGHALASLQGSKGIRFDLTLQVNTDTGTGPGLDSQAQILVSDVVEAGARIARVNVMVMSFGDSRPANETEAQAAIVALDGAQVELKGLVPGLTDGQAWAMLGATPEIGQNDQNVGEIFTPEDATALATFALSHGMGLVSFWSIDRDRVCSGPCGFQKYSTVDTSNYQFADAFLAVLH